MAPECLWWCRGCGVCHSRCVEGVAGVALAMPALPCFAAASRVRAIGGMTGDYDSCVDDRRRACRGDDFVSCGDS